MDQQAFDQFRQHYMRVSEEELEALDARKATLVEEAQIALGEVLSQRGVSVERIRHDNATEDERHAELARAAVKRREARDAKLLKWFLIISTPLIALSILLRPEPAWQTLLSSTVQALGLFVIAWVVLFIKRRLSGKNVDTHEDDV